MREALTSRGFRYLLSAVAVSSTGDWLYGAALLAYVFEQSGSLFIVAVASTLRLLPYILFGVIGGSVADRFDRRRVMIAADLIRAGLMLLLTIAAATSGSVWLAVAISFAAAGVTTAHHPAMVALTPAVVDEEHLAPANSILSTVEHVAIAAGPALGGVLLILGSPAIAFLVNGLTFVASAALTLRVHDGSHRPERGNRPADGHGFLEGLRALRSSVEIIGVVVVMLATTIFWGLETVVLVLVAEERLGLGSEGVGFLFASIGVGGILAAGVTGRLTAQPKLGRVLAASMLLSGAAVLGLVATRTPAVAYALLTLDGAGSIILDVVVVTTLQRTVAPQLLGRVSGTLDSVAVAGMLLGLLAAPLLHRWTGLTSTLLITGIWLPAVALVASPLLRRLSVTSSQRFREIDPVVEFLSGLSVFEGASRPALEAVAMSLRTERVRAGETVVREGDEADDFFVIATGKLEVLSSGEAGEAPRRMGTLGPGAYFGEIGILEGIPRTATVRAITDCELYRIDGQAFRDAVTQAPRISAALAGAIRLRLARTHPSHRVATSGASDE